MEIIFYVLPPPSLAYKIGGIQGVNILQPTDQPPFLPSTPALSLSLSLWMFSLSLTKWCEDTPAARTDNNTCTRGSIVRTLRRKAGGRAQHKPAFRDRGGGPTYLLVHQPRLVASSHATHMYWICGGALVTKLEKHDQEQTLRFMFTSASWKYGKRSKRDEDVGSVGPKRA